MGRLLQVRVSASTFNPADVMEAWPLLTKLAWEDPDIPTHGVMELARTLFDQMKINMLDAAVVERLASDIEKAEALRKDLAKALADWKPGEADRLSYLLEDMLDQMEDILRKI